MALTYQLKITLNHTQPPIWRRVLVPGDFTLDNLHEIIQIAMGWEDHHLHLFRIGDRDYMYPAEDEDNGWLETHPTDEITLSDLFPIPGASFSYEYDFGDSWEHTINIEKILPEEDNLPRCTAGEYACPPEDVGGTWGYENFLDAIRDPDHPEHEEYLEWAGDDFDPEVFNPATVNGRLKRISTGSHPQQGAGLQSALGAITWILGLPDEAVRTIEELPLRHDIIAMLEYLRDHKVVGTQSTGNFPLKHVRAISARFVEPPVLDNKIGDKVFKLRTEDDVRSLVFRHVLAEAAGLIKGGHGRRWTLTPAGEKYLAAAPALQYLPLILTRWHVIDWGFFLPILAKRDFFPEDFNLIVRKRLTAASPGTPQLFPPFADDIINAAGLVWRIEDQEMAHLILQGIVRSTVIEPLGELGLLIPEYGPHESLGERYRQLNTFEVTSLGRRVLEAVG